MEGVCLHRSAVEDEGGGRGRQVKECTRNRIMKQEERGKRQQARRPREVEPDVVQPKQNNNETATCSSLLCSALLCNPGPQDRGRMQSRTPIRGAKQHSNTPHSLPKHAKYSKQSTPNFNATVTYGTRHQKLYITLLPP
jgi:hypothetical protein